MCTPGFTARAFLANEEETTALGLAMAPLLETGDVLLLSGDIGAGKTHLARTVIQALMIVPEDVPSPTYTLIQTYVSEKHTIWHADLYRVSDASEIEELGLQDAFETAIVLVEWPDRLDTLPENALHITLTEEAQGRRIELASKDPRWSRLKDIVTDA